MCRRAGPMASGVSNVVTCALGTRHCGPSLAPSRDMRFRRIVVAVLAGVFCALCGASCVQSPTAVSETEDGTAPSPPQEATPRRLGGRRTWRGGPHSGERAGRCRRRRGGLKHRKGQPQILRGGGDRPTPVFALQQRQATLGQPTEVRRPSAPRQRRGAQQAEPTQRFDVEGRHDGMMGAMNTAGDELSKGPFGCFHGVLPGGRIDRKLGVPALDRCHETRNTNGGDHLGGHQPFEHVLFVVGSGRHHRHPR